MTGNQVSSRYSMACLFSRCSCSSRLYNPGTVEREREGVEDVSVVCNQVALMNSFAALSKHFRCTAETEQGVTHWHLILSFYLSPLSNPLSFFLFISHLCLLFCQLSRHPQFGPLSTLSRWPSWQSLERALVARGGTGASQQRDLIAM